MNIAVLGAGTWGTAISIHLARNGHQITLWSRNTETVKKMNGTRSHSKLNNVTLHESIQITDNLEHAIQNKKLIIIAVPSIAVRSLCRKLKVINKDVIIMNVSKGIEENTLKTISEQISEELPNNQVSILSGPSHAEEVANEIPTSCVIGCLNTDLAKELKNVFMSENFRVYTSRDIIGIEIGAALKNVIALAAGVSDGLGFGDNTKAALITRGISEITRLGVAVGGEKHTFAGLTGIGDLIVTCSSQHSRNRKAGFLIGSGYTMEQAMKEVDMVVEGVYSAKAALALAEKYHVEMPIVAQVNNILFKNIDPRQAVRDLMIRDNDFE